MSISKISDFEQVKFVDPQVHEVFDHLRTAQKLAETYNLGNVRVSLLAVMLSMCAGSDSDYKLAEYLKEFLIKEMTL